jgi:serine/threonine-protein kinase
MQLKTNTLEHDDNRIVSCWKLGDQITGGRWFELFRAKPKTLGPESDYDYVIKLVNSALPSAKKQQAIDRLGREALATETILHNNVIRLLDAELDNPSFFLVQPWVCGRSFDRFLSTAQQMPINRLLWVVRQVAEAIFAGHLCGRVHLGLDPSHVLLGRTGRVKLIGWSQSHGIGERAWLPHDQLQLARYTAPECFDKEYRASVASDVYSLGVLIYHALTQRVPFDGLSISEVHQASIREIPIDLMIRQPLCPPALYRLVRKMLAKNPTRRPAFKEVLETLITIEIDHLCDVTAIPL